MRKDPKIFLDDMIYSIERIEEMATGLSGKEFRCNMEKQDAIIRRLSVIGEATNNLPKDLKEKYTGIEWRKIINMRNFLIHEYFEIDLELVWDTVKDDLPKLRAELVKIRKESG